MGEATHGYGIKLYRGTSTAGTLLGDLVDVTPPTKTREMKDASHHGGANKIRKKMGGMRDLGEAAFTIHFEPGAATETSLNADYMSDDPVDYTIVYPNEEEEELNAYVSEISKATPLDDIMKMSFKLTLSGN